MTLYMYLYSYHLSRYYSISTDIGSDGDACVLNMAVIADGSCLGDFSCAFMGRAETDGDVIAPVDSIGPNSWYVLCNYFLFFLFYFHFSIKLF